MQIDYRKYMDYDKLDEILLKNKQKKIICFGAGSATYVFPRILPQKHKIDYFVDSNPRLWGTKADGIEIKDPQVLKKEKRGTFIVFIVSQHYRSMEEQLNLYGLTKGIDYYEIYSSIEKCFLIQKAAVQAEGLLEFINGIPEDMFKSVHIRSKKRIGVVALYEFNNLHVFYDIGLFLLLKYNGYMADLILDKTTKCEDFTLYDGASNDIVEIVDIVIKNIKERFKDINIFTIDDNMVTADLDELDKANIRKKAQLSTAWQKSRNINRILSMSKSLLEEKFIDVFNNNLKSIKSFFENSQENYDVLSVCTALHFSRGLYMWMGEKYGIRVANYDSAGDDMSTTWATDYPNGHNYDIPKIILNKMLSNEENNKIIELSKSLFNNNLGSISNGVTNSYQIVQEEVNDIQDKVWYDVIIPLNVMWDAAAIGLNDAFDTESEWIVETIQYILEKTSASIMIREHPAQLRLKRFNNESFGELIKNKFGNNRRLRFVRYDEKINTYEYIKRCKLVLPLSSTVGIESALLGKDVIIHSKCYYSKLNFVHKAKDKEEYFSLINQCFNNTLPKKDRFLDEAWISYYLLHNRKIHTVFNETNPEWIKMSLDKLNELDDVKKIIDVICEDIPIMYVNVKDILKRII